MPINVQNFTLYFKIVFGMPIAPAQFTTEAMSISNFTDFCFFIIPKTDTKFSTVRLMSNLFGSTWLPLKEFLTTPSKQTKQKVLTIDQFSATNSLNRFLCLLNFGFICRIFKINNVFNYGPSLKRILFIFLY